MIALEGKLAIAYQAIVESKYRADQINTIEETSLAELPLDVVPYLYPYATRLSPTNGLVRIATGRDAADVAFATVFGAVQLNKMNVYIENIGDRQEASNPDTAYANIST